MLNKHISPNIQPVRTRDIRFAHAETTFLLSLITRISSLTSKATANILTYSINIEILL